MGQRSAGDGATTSHGRRDFVRTVALGTLAVAGPRALWAAEAAAPVAFCGANLVARVSGYRFELANWMKQHNATVEATDADEWRAICEEIAAAGFEAIEVWEAHASPLTLDSQGKASEWKKVMREAGLKPVAYAGTLSRETLQVCEWLEIPHVDGQIGALPPDEATRLCSEFEIGFNLENHPQKTSAEILEPIGGGNEWLGVCIDTGWLGSQGAPGPRIIEECGDLVRHTHIKDVAAAGGHSTVLLGEGVVDPAACIQALKGLGYQGWYSWEDEPEDRNPMDSAERNRLWIEEQVKA
jgi:L-ribulose-5-phosphate 3-epimerase